MELGEMIAVVLAHDDKHSPSTCPFCRSNEESAPENVKTIVDANWDEDPDESINNDAGELERNMRDNKKDPRPTGWTISFEHAAGGLKNHNVTPNPHHLIPGNESLKQSDVTDWLFADAGLIEHDVGYNVNNEENGIWLPSNNSMRSDSRWTNTSFKYQYVIHAMKETNGHFHDRHGKPYSDFVTKTLNTIAERMHGIDSKACPYETEKTKAGNKFLPPYALIPRLNGVSSRLRGHLKADSKPNDFIYTSKLVKEAFWDRKKRKRDSNDSDTDD